MINRLLAKNNVKILLVVFLISLGLLFLRDLNPTTLDANLGIEFVGGVRVPISLERSVDSDTMSLMVETIKSRINKFGLTQAVVRPLGDKEIIVEIPKAGSGAIESIERILREQGRFEAIVDSREVLNGNDIIASAIGGTTGESVQQINGQVQWSLVFSVTADGQAKFGELASGKRGLPVYMFLDRPEFAVVIIDDSTSVFNQDDLLNSLKKQGDDIVLFNEKDFLLDKQKLLSFNKTQVVLSQDLKESNPELVSFLRSNGFNETGTDKKLSFKPAEDFSPVFLGGSLSSWRAIGLQSAPTLQVEPLKQRIITQYSISGTSPGDTPEEQLQNGVNEIKELKTVLSGGRLPVSTIVGSYYDVAPVLGRQFLVYSFLGIIAAILAVALVLALRYQSIKLVIPIVLTNVIEVVILLALLGSFGTLELSAMAGVIALIGTGVDNQILITDELLRKKQGEEEVSEKEKFKRAFYIVFATAAIAIVSMMPLFLSGIVEVMGFALATILGIIIGVGVTRPAYGALVEELYGFKK
ncbi:hypothetical protein HUU53_03355 [Candidatus Micrarchaeota archaeon]|nr:hypothetical protein [Candidatus Micrarchaeota archaeon]